MGQWEYSAHYLLPATLFVTKEPNMVSTILGSCVSVCLWDFNYGIGGINHFMLPLWNGKELASPKYGNIATMILFERMLDIGCRRENLVAKIFGGGDILNITSNQFNIGERNIEIARENLKELNIKIVGTSVGGPHGRKIVFDTRKGTVIQRYIEKTNNK